jgi:hypothetical protein
MQRARAMMFALGCIQAQSATPTIARPESPRKDPALVAGLVVADKAVRVRNSPAQHRAARSPRPARGQRAVVTGAAAPLAHFAACEPRRSAPHTAKCTSTLRDGLAARSERAEELRARLGSGKARLFRLRDARNGLSGPGWHPTPGFR